MIEGQLAEIKKSLEVSRMKDKENIIGNYLLSTLINKISQKALKIIFDEIAPSTRIKDDPENLCRHYFRLSHRLYFSLLDAHISSIV